jgi:hypothetical protein
MALKLPRLGRLAKTATIVGGFATAGTLLLQAGGQGHPSVIGSQITVTAGPGSSGNIIGESINVTAGPGSQGTVIGKQVTTVGVGAPNPSPGLVTGKDSTVTGYVPPHSIIGDGSTVIGPTDQRGNTIQTEPMAIGRGACPAPGSIIVGAYANAGACAAQPSPSGN